jgi:hypothetical protein
MTSHLDVNILDALDFEPDFPCEAGEDARCATFWRDEYIPHPADWYVAFSCGCAKLVCSLTLLFVWLHTARRNRQCPDCNTDAVEITRRQQIRKRKRGD